MVADVQPSRYFPYVGAPGWLTTLRDLFRRTVPQRLDVDWLTTADRFSFSQPNAKQLLSMLQKIGWISADGTVQEAGRILRAQAAPYEEAMERVLQQFYPDLLEQIESSQQFTAHDVDQFFVAASDMGKSGRQQMIAVFRWFLRESGKIGVEERVWARRGRTESPVREVRRAAPRPTKPAARAKSTGAPERNAVSHAEGEPQADSRLTTIASVLRINIDGTWDEPRVDAVFRRLDKLLKGEEL